MKQLTGFVLALALALSLVGCGQPKTGREMVDDGMVNRDGGLINDAKESTERAFQSAEDEMTRAARSAGRTMDRMAGRP